MLLADLPLCRLNYQMQLAYYVTPEKEINLMSKESFGPGKPPTPCSVLCRGL